METEACSNCGTAIGKLESACVWRGSVVCFSCHKRLQEQFTQTIITDAGPVPAELRPRYANIAAVPRKFKDYLAGPRWVCLILVAVAAIAAACGFIDGYEFAFWLALIWIVLGICSIVMRAAWKQRDHF